MDPAFWHIFHIHSVRCHLKGTRRYQRGIKEIVKSEDRQDNGQQNKTKDKHRTHSTTIKTKAGVTGTLQKPG